MLKRILCLGMLIALNTITLHASDDTQSQERSSANENQLFNDDENKNETNFLVVQSESDKEGEDKDNSGSNYLACDCEEEISNRAGECKEEESSQVFAAQEEESKEDSALFLCCKNCE